MGRSGAAAAHGAAPDGWMRRRPRPRRSAASAILLVIGIGLPGPTGGAPVVSAAPRIVAIRHFASAASTRLVVELSAPVEPAVSAVPAAGEGPPRRLYVDLPGVRLDGGVPKAFTMPAGPLAGVRVGWTGDGAARLVIETRGTGTYAVARLASPARVVLDVQAQPETDASAAVVTAPTPAATMSPAQATSAASEPTVASIPSARSPDGPAGVEPDATNGAANAGPPGRAAPAAPEPSRRPGGDGRRAPLLASAAPRIVIDPGHGGKDPGARGVNGALEKDVVLAIARRLAGELRRELGATVVLTRDRDVYLPLEARTARANAEEADLFISVHANASVNSDLAGVETYYLNNTNDRATMRLAAMENGLGLVGGAPRTASADLSYILSDLVQKGKLEDSIALANSLHGGLVSHLRAAHPDLTDLGVKQGPFYVLVGAYMPCVLVETSFLTHPVEGRRLGTRTYRDRVAKGLARGVQRYLEQLRRARTL
jgi:N-acetylmuramoyl-L-alanine amidase